MAHFHLHNDVTGRWGHDASSGEVREGASRVDGEDEAVDIVVVFIGGKHPLEVIPRSGVIQDERKSAGEERGKP